MYAAIANGGTLWKPTIGKAIVETDGTVVKAFEREKVGTLPTDKKTLRFLQSSLREVVISGTGAGVFSGFPIEISGKTGTAEVFGKNPNGSDKADTSWFASYGPTKKPRFAVVMMVSQGGFGASTSGVGVKKIYETLFGVLGAKVASEKIIFPSGVPPVTLPKISPATKVKGAQ
jgi:penicillin-binding protein 2